MNIYVFIGLGVITSLINYVLVEFLSPIYAYSIISIITITLIIYSLKTHGERSITARSIVFLNIIFILMKLLPILLIPTSFAGAYFISGGSNDEII